MANKAALKGRKLVLIILLILSMTLAAGYTTAVQAGPSGGTTACPGCG
ncbi:MAG: hypothetical protein J0L63_15430 [Anaerolineae bacterium]|nr:hypothetical protein [Anaerolineae bacterium]